MTHRAALLLAAAAFAGLATPALAQHHDDGPPPLPEIGGWDEAAPGPDGPIRREVRIMRHGGPGADGADYYPAPGYLPEQIDWLEDCRENRDDRREIRGEAIGAGVGAVFGGVAGNRIAGRGDRTAGTLIGAGVGALAGAAVGGAVADGGDRRGPDWCEDFMARYYADHPGGYGVADDDDDYGPHRRGPAPYGYPAYYAGAEPAPGFGYAYPYPYPVVWVRVPIVTEHRDCGCEVVEEVIEEHVVERAPRPAPRRAARTVRRGKIVRARPTK